MLDIKFIRENKEKIIKAIKSKGVILDLDRLFVLDDKRKDLITQIDTKRALRNELAKSSKGGKPTHDQIQNGKQLKEEIIRLEEKMKSIEGEYTDMMVKIPNYTSDDTPVGKDEKDNIEVYKWGKPTEFKFKPKSHIELGESLDLLDLERGVKVAGYRGYYVKNEAVMLQMALMMFALFKLIEKGFMPMIPPTLVKEFALFGTGYFAGKKYDPQVDEIYRVANKDEVCGADDNKENKFLVGTSEPSLLAYYAGEVLEEKNLPLKICGFSQCYRSEIGSYGKDTKGIYRVHEFMKVEQVCISTDNIDLSEQLHQEMVEISKEIHQELGLPYRQLQICTGDMGVGKYKMYDLEAWMPSRNAYGETGSASNFLDWQSRRLDVRYNAKDGGKKNVFMLNNTAMPSPRMIIAILENYQTEDGGIEVPEVLRKFMPGNIARISPKK